MPSLEARSVSYRVGQATLLDRVSLCAVPGEVLAIVGPNGAGKSTLLKLLSGDLAPTGGDVLLDARPLGEFGTRELALHRAVMPQQTLLQFAFTAFEVVLMGRSPRAGSRRGESERDYEIVRECLIRTDSGPLSSRIYPTLSTGEQQRVTLARVLAQEARVLLLDEPTASLDIRHQELVMQIARDAALAGGTVLAVVHDLNLAAAYAHRVCVLSHGSLVACGTPADVLTAALLTRVFEHPITVLKHPLRDCPLVLPGTASP